MRNNSEKDVTVDITKIGMDIKSLKPEAKLLQSTIKNGLSEGTYTNVFDGNLSTYILTKENPAKDSYITFDLGKTIEVYDVEAVTSDGLQRLYNAKIQISKTIKTGQMWRQLKMTILLWKFLIAMCAVMRKVQKQDI
ncbi:MAG: hypothetical protein ACLU8S_09100 [Coprococcus phoceensis]